MNFALDPPKIGFLTGKVCPADLPQPRKQVRVGPAKVSEDIAFCIDPEKFAYPFRSERLAISQGRL